MDKNTEKLEMFRKAIQQQADEELAAVTAEMQARRASAEKSRAELSAKTELDKIKTETSRANAQFKRDMSKCDYEMKKSVLDHRNRLITDFFADTEEKLRAYAASDLYEGCLKRALEKIRSTIAIDSATVIYAREQDIPLVRSLISCEVAADSTIRLGGLRAMCRSKNVFCDVTLDAALQDEKQKFIEKKELML